MRKLFWCCAVAAVAVAGGLYLAAKPVEHRPFLVVAEAMRVLYEGGARLATGSAPETEVVPADPIEVSADEPETNAQGEVVAIAGEDLPAHIVVEDPTPASAESVHPPLAEPATVPGYSPSARAAQPYPTHMPYCNDDGHSRPGTMPYADDEVGADEASDEGSEDAGSFCDLIFRLVEELYGAVEPTEDEYVCPEDRYHHEHEMVCPHTGRSYPRYAPSPAVPDGEENEEKPESDPYPEKPGKKAPTVPPGEDLEEQDFELPLFELDTMEFRPSDAGLHPFIPGPV